MPRYTLDKDSWIDHLELPAEVEIDFERLWALHPLEYDKVMLYGKEVSMPRWTQSFGLPYTFSGVEHASVPIPEELRGFFRWANASTEYAPFNQLYVNWYQNGLHYIGAHRDNECILDGVTTPILNLSLGSERKFRLRDYGTKQIVRDIPFCNRQILVMGGRTNLDYTHEVPKISGKRGLEVGRRISITLRRFKA